MFLAAAVSLIHAAVSAALALFGLVVSGHKLVGLCHVLPDGVRLAQAPFCLPGLAVSQHMALRASDWAIINVAFDRERREEGFSLVFSFARLSFVEESSTLTLDVDVAKSRLLEEAAHLVLLLQRNSLHVQQSVAFA